MNKFKNPLIAGAVLAGLGLIGSLMNSHPAILRAAGGPTVTIDPAQLPLPVTGSTTVKGTVTANIAGTVPATQSGLWNVGITGQPIGVTVNNLPPVLNLDEPGREPYNANVSPFFSLGGNGVVFFSFPFVPSGKRLIITHLTGSIFWCPSASANQLVAQLQLFGALGPHGVVPIPITPFGGSCPNTLAMVDWGGTAAVEGGGSAQVEVDVDVPPIGSKAPIGTNSSMYLAGYMITCDATHPCTPIAP